MRRSSPGVPSGDGMAAPSRPGSHLALGIIYEQQENYGEAIAEYQKAISLRKERRQFSGNWDTPMRVQVREMKL